MDVTNWPMADVGGPTDVAVLRPTEVLFEEWAQLRAAGTMTPSIAVWPCSPAGGTTWQYLLNRIYNNDTLSSLVYTQEVAGGGRKKVSEGVALAAGAGHVPAGAQVVFLPYAGGNCYDAATRAAIESNGGRNDVVGLFCGAVVVVGGGRCEGSHCGCVPGDGAYVGVVRPRHVPSGARVWDDARGCLTRRAGRECMVSFLPVQMRPVPTQLA